MNKLSLEEPWNTYPCKGEHNSLPQQREQRIQEDLKQQRITDKGGSVLKLSLSRENIYSAEARRDTNK